MEKVTVQTNQHNSRGMVMYTAYYCGVISLGEKIRFSDPCYDRNLWCSMEYKNPEPGLYRAYIIEKIYGPYDAKGNGNYSRVTSIVLAKSDKFGKWVMPLVGWKTIDSVGVDSGQAGIFSDEIYPPSEDSAAFKIFYKTCCDLTLDKDPKGGIIDGKGLVSSSGYGDGCYTVFGTGNAYMIDFMSGNGREISDILSAVRLFGERKTEENK